MTGVEVFLLRRHTGAAFAAGMYVFPGGRVDELDGAEGLGECCDGPDDAAASELLGVERGGLAFLVAAIRECFEESGLLLAHRRDGAPLPAPAAADRVAVHDGALSMLGAVPARRPGARHRGAALRGALGHPRGGADPSLRHPLLPRRRRRLTTTKACTTTSRRSTACGRRRPRRCDAAWPARSMVMPPTMAGLELLEGCATVADVLAKADGARPPGADRAPPGVRRRRPRPRRRRRRPDHADRGRPRRDP